MGSLAQYHCVNNNSISTHTFLLKYSKVSERKYIANATTLHFTIMNINISEKFIDS
jgi:hypothetical protein